jgi:hypothetical protein
MSSPAASGKAFTPNARFSPAASREARLLTRAAGAVLITAAVAAIVTSRQDSSSAIFLSRARTALIETVLDRAEKAPRAAASAPSNVLSAGRLAAPLISPRQPAPPVQPASQAAAEVIPASGATSAVATKAPVAPASTPSVTAAKATKDAHPAPARAAAPAAHPALAAKAAVAPQIVPPALKASAPAAQTPATPLATAAASAPTAPVRPVTAAELAKASATNSVEMVKRTDANVTKVDRDGVTMGSGRRIPIGGMFSSGERLLATDPANDQVVTDRRTIVLF